VTAQITNRYAAALEASGDKKQAKQIRAEAKEKIAVFAATDRAAHTVDVLDLLPRK
jgi:hypothetical protein